MTHNRQNSWHNLLGAVVDDHQNRINLQKGFVEEAIADTSVLRIAADRLSGRALIAAAEEATEAQEVRVEPKHLGGTHAYPMVWPANRPGYYGWHRPADAHHDRLRYRNRSVVTERA